MNQVSVGFSRLSVPIFNATIDEQYPIKAGLTGLPAGEADSSFPEITFLPDRTYRPCGEGRTRERSPSISTTTRCRTT